jgi:hypothetical protein
MSWPFETAVDPPRNVTARVSSGFTVQMCETSIYLFESQSFLQWANSTEVVLSCKAGEVILRFYQLQKDEEACEVGSSKRQTCILAAGKRTEVAYNSDLASESIRFSQLWYLLFRLNWLPIYNPKKKKKLNSRWKPH